MRTTLPITLAAILIAAPCQAGHDDIVDTAVKAGSFKTLVAAVKAAGLVDTLKGKGPFTVFAPTDAAFEKLPKGTIEALLQDKAKLAKILTYHVLPGKVPAAKVVKLHSATTVQGGALAIAVKGDKVFVNESQVVKTDIVCSNGIIHVIDAVLLPPAPTKKTDIVDTAVKAGSFKTLVAAVKAAGLVDTLKGKGPFTVFAPTDAAFEKLPKGTIEALLQDKAKLAKILTYHVLPGKFPAAKVVKLHSATTVQGSEVAIKVEKGKVFVDQARVVKTDIACSNGIIHVIDSVIIPGKTASAPAGSSYSIDDYFPLENAGAYRYRKSTEGRGFFRGRQRKETLLRRPRLRGDDLRIRDSEGEFQDFFLGRKGPAMKAQSMTAQGFVQTYEPGITLFPSKAVLGEAETFASIIKHKDRSGIHTGAIERVVTLEGVETLRTPAGRFVDCLRFRAVTINRPKLDESFIARQDETIWLARGIGEVKSVSRTRLQRGAMTFMDVTVTLELEAGPERHAAPREAARFF